MNEEKYLEMRRGLTTEEDVVCPCCGKVGCTPVEIFATEMDVAWEWKCPECDSRWEELYKLDGLIITENTMKG